MPTTSVGMRFDRLFPDVGYLRAGRQSPSSSGIAEFAVTLGAVEIKTKLGRAVGAAVVWLSALFNWGNGIVLTGPLLPWLSGVGRKRTSGVAVGVCVAGDAGREGGAAAASAGALVAGAGPGANVRGVVSVGEGP